MGHFVLCRLAIVHGRNFLSPLTCGQLVLSFVLLQASLSSNSKNELITCAAFSSKVKQKTVWKWKFKSSSLLVIPRKKKYLPMNQPSHCSWKIRSASVGKKYLRTSAPLLEDLIFFAKIIRLFSFPKLEMALGFSLTSCLISLTKHVDSIESGLSRVRLRAYKILFRMIYSQKPHRRCPINHRSALSL